jgi:hypothetical protein
MLKATAGKVAAIPANLTATALRTCRITATMIK